jgi:hypothetical protein
MKIKQKNDLTKIGKPAFFRFFFIANFCSALTAPPPPPPPADNADQAVAPVAGPTQTVVDFDMAEVKKFAQSIVTNTALMAFFHFKMEASIPVYFQIFMVNPQLYLFIFILLYLLGHFSAVGLADVSPQCAGRIRCRFSRFNSAVSRPALTLCRPDGAVYRRRRRECRSGRRRI